MFSGPEGRASTEGQDGRTNQGREAESGRGGDEGRAGLEAAGGRLHVGRLIRLAWTVLFFYSGPGGNEVTASMSSHSSTSLRRDGAAAG